MRYLIYISWRCDQEEYYCTDSQSYEVDDLGEFLLELPKKIEYIERRGTIISIQVSRAD
jgi:hypothetical protein